MKLQWIIDPLSVAMNQRFCCIPYPFKIPKLGYCFSGLNWLTRSKSNIFNIMKIVCLLAIYLSSYYGFAQTLSDHESLEVVTWNLQWFGHHHPDTRQDKGPKDEELQVNNALKVIEAMGKPDLILFQEITSDNFFRQLAQRSGYRYFLSPGGEGKQRIGLFHNDQVTSIGEPQQILVNKKKQFAQRPPVLAKFSHSSVSEFYVIGFHLKAHWPPAPQNEKIKSWKRRKKAAELTKEYLEQHLEGEKVIVLGDWNDDVDVSNLKGYETPFKNFLPDPTVRFVTKYLSFSNNKSSKHGSVIDHVLITDDLFSDFVGTGVFNALDMKLDYHKTISDHYPVFVVFE